MYKNILACVALQRYFDFTPTAKLVRKYAVDLSKTYEARLHIFSSKADIALVAEDQTVENKLEKFAEPIHKEGIDFKTIVVEGDPKELILAKAQELQSNIIIIGSHSKRSIFDIAIGGTALHVLKNAPCEVIMVSPNKDEVEKTKELIIPEYPFIFPYF